METIYRRGLFQIENDDCVSKTLSGKCNCTFMKVPHMVTSIPWTTRDDEWWLTDEDYDTGDPTAWDEYYIQFLEWRYKAVGEDG